MFDIFELRSLGGLMKILMTTIFTFALSLPALGFGGDPVTNVCDKQIAGYLSSNFDADVLSIRYLFDDDDASRRRSSARVRASNCSGEYVFELRANKIDCTIAHYGRIPNYIRYVWTTGNCPK